MRALRWVREGTHEYGNSRPPELNALCRADRRTSSDQEEPLDLSGIVLARNRIRVVPMSGRC